MGDLCLFHCEETHTIPETPAPMMIIFLFRLFGWAIVDVGEMEETRVGVVGGKALR